MELFVTPKRALTPDNFYCKMVLTEIYSLKTETVWRNGVTRASLRNFERGSPRITMSVEVVLYLFFNQRK